MGKGFCVGKVTQKKGSKAEAETASGEQKNIACKCKDQRGGNPEIS